MYLGAPAADSGSGEFHIDPFAYSLRSAIKVSGEPIENADVRTLVRTSLENNESIELFSVVDASTALENISVSNDGSRIALSYNSGTDAHDEKTRQFIVLDYKGNILLELTLPVFLASFDPVGEKIAIVVGESEEEHLSGFSSTGLAILTISTGQIQWILHPSATEVGQIPAIDWIQSGEIYIMGWNNLQRVDIKSESVVPLNIPGVCGESPVRPKISPDGMYVTVGPCGLSDKIRLYDIRAQIERPELLSTSIDQQITNSEHEIYTQWCGDTGSVLLVEAMPRPVYDKTTKSFKKPGSRWIRIVNIKSGEKLYKDDSPDKSFNENRGSFIKIPKNYTVIRESGKLKVFNKQGLETSPKED
jgi:hypothetical protein